MTQSVRQAAIEELVLANRILANEEVLDAFGHVSLRDPEDPRAFYLSRSRSPGLIEAADIMRFDLDGNLLEGDKKPYLETVIHAAILKARPDVASVVHHHAPSVLPFALVAHKLRPVFHLGAVAGAEVPVWDSQDEFGDTSLLVSDMAMAGSLAKAMGAGSAALLKRHGAVCAANSLKQAVFVSICMRDNARLLLEALAFGEPSYLTPGEIAAAAEKHDGGAPVERAWEFWASRITA